VDDAVTVTDVIEPEKEGAEGVEDSDPTASKLGDSLFKLAFDRHSITLVINSRLEQFNKKMPLNIFDTLKVIDKEENSINSIDLVEEDPQKV